MLKRIIVVAALPVLIAASGCDDAKKQELQKDYNDMVTETALLHKDIESRDKYIDQIMQSVNQIYVDLERARSKEVKLLKNTRDAEGRAKLTQEQVRKAILDELYVVRTNLRDNSRKVSDLQRKLIGSAVKYASLEALVDNLKSSVAEREQSIATLEAQVRNLEGSVAAKSRELVEKDAMIVAKDNAIEDQRARINTVYYIVGKKDELKERGIISDEGGFLWGLLGSTTTLSADADSSDFKQIDMTRSPAIHVDGKVDEILPKRSASSFQLAQMGDHEGYVMIKNPKTFWKEKYLVIVLD